MNRDDKILEDMVSDLKTLELPSKEQATIKELMTHIKQDIEDIRALTSLIVALSKKEPLNNPPQQTQLKTEPQDVESTQPTPSTALCKK